MWMDIKPTVRDASGVIVLTLCRCDRCPALYGPFHRITRRNSVISLMKSSFEILALLFMVNYCTSRYIFQYFYRFCNDYLVRYMYFRDLNVKKTVSLIHL